MTTKEQAASLIIRQDKGKPPLNKSQKTFNRLIRQVEQLQKKIELQQKHLDELFHYYGQRLRPLEVEVCKRQTTLIKRLFQLSQSVKRLTEKHVFGLEQALKNLLSDILAVTERPEDDEMEAIFKMINGKTYNEIWEDELEEMKDQLNYFARINDMDVNLDWFHKDMDEDAIMEKMFDEAKRLRGQKDEREAKEARKYRTKRQIKKEQLEKETEELKNRSLSEIYKQLAKVLHPDLEPDPERKKEKEALMKKLTVAYKEKNLHALLLLELEWIHKEEGELEKLTELKLNSYNEMLKTQIIELENELYAMRKHPRYEPLFGYSLDFLGVLPNMTFLEKGYNDQKNRKKEIEEIIDKMNGDNSEREFKAYLQEFYIYFIRNLRYRL